MDEARRWEVYSQILSSDNVTLSYSPDAATATFDVSSRHVILPTWDCLDEMSTQALASHEIGHAKFSTYALEDFKELFTRYKDLFNVVEDARVERLMKKEFKGLKAIFQDGYSTIAKGGVFPLEDVETASLIERLNIFTKFGFMMDVPFFTKEEAEFSYRILNLSTKTDVVDLCEDILDYLKKTGADKSSSSTVESLKLGEQKPSSGEISENVNTDDSTSIEADEDDINESKRSSKSDSKELNSDNSDETNKEIDKEGKDEQECETDGDASISPSELDELLKDNRTRSFERNINDIFKERKEKSEKHLVIIDSEDVLQDCYVDLSEAAFHLDGGRIPKNLLNVIEKSAAAAAARFHQKKSALENQARRKVNVGRVDTRRLAKYSVSDAIFKTTEKLAQGCNHGVVLLMDFSMSMSMIHNVQRCACLQAAILGRFCQMTGIPFSIIVFGGEARYGWHNTSAKMVVKLADSSHFDPRIFARLAEIRQNRGHIAIEDVDGQKYYFRPGGGTPTLQALLVARNEVKSMRKQGVEKIAVIVSTDGGYSRRIATSYSGIDVDFMQKLILDGKSYSISDLQGLKKDRMTKMSDWAFELFAGYIKKETGASFIYSYIGPKEDFQNNYNRWNFIEKEFLERGIMHNVRACVEPYLFRRAFATGQSVAKLGSKHMNIFDTPCHSVFLDNDSLFEQFLTMNSSCIEKCSTTKGAFAGVNDEQIVGILSSYNKMFNAFKAFANAFVDFFS